MTRKEKLKLKKTIFGILLITMFALGIISGNIRTNIENNPDSEMGWHWIQAPLVWATNNTTHGGSAGVTDIYTLNDAFNSWDTFIDENDANIYEETDGDFTDASVAAPHEELDGTTPHSTDFHIAVVYQFEDSMAKDGGTWNVSRVKAYINTTGLTNDASSVLMSKSAAFYHDQNTYARITFYLLDDDGGADDNNALQLGIDSTYSANVTIWYYGS